MKLQLFDTKKIGMPKESKLFLSLIPTFKEKRTQQFTTLALSFITMAFFGLFAISPTFGTIADLQKQIDDSNFVHDSMQKKIVNLTTLQEMYAIIQPDLNVITNVIPTSPAIDTLTGQVHTIAGLTNVQITRMQTFPVDISLVTATAPYTSYTFSVEVEGDDADLQKFITYMGNFNRLVSLDQITMTHIGKIDNTYRLSLKGRTYFKPE